MSNSPAPVGSSATSRRLQKIGSPSKRGKQHQTIRASRSTSAAIALFPINSKVQVAHECAPRAVYANGGLCVPKTSSVLI